mmetsp:Transcript_4556/g.6234  ORF Transcript_4556/g.6234 Transcript_4556/m.6234 type:complete len:596 (+) Transcript_4556:792-2579(+)
MEALGYLEGYATCQEMNEWYVNFYSGLFDGGDPTFESLHFLDDNHQWLVKQAELLWLESDYWMAVRGLLLQLDGMVRGAQEGCPGSEQDKDTARLGAFLPNLQKQPTLIHLLLMNANGDLYQIADKYDQRKSPPSDVLDEYADDDYYADDKNNKHKKGKKPPLKKESVISALNKMEGEVPQKAEMDENGRRYIMGSPAPPPPVRNDDSERVEGDKLSRARRSRSGRRHDHCSAIVKLLPDLSDVLFGHNTWDDYQCAAPRIFKRYTHSRMIGSLPAGSHDMFFSSSPGLLSSVDDFYTIDGAGHMAVFETTIDMYNYELLKLVVPQSLLSWTRARVANQLAVDGQDWAKLFSQFHSGTYVNEWMVLDFDRFSPGRVPEDGFLTVLEEIPGLIHYEDMTAHLIEQEYWASYNNPFFDDISEASGNAALCRAQPLTACHDSDPRAAIFRQRQSSVSGLAGLQALLTYNDFHHDPLSLNDSCNAIACRQDLAPLPQDRYPFGAIDAKATSVILARGGLVTPSSSQQLNEQQHPKQSPPQKAKKIEPKVLLKMGPTTSNHLPPFCWNQFENMRNGRGLKFFHNGQPHCFQYDWQVMPPP